MSIIKVTTWIFLLISLSGQSLFSQTSVSGKVTDIYGVPIIGVNVWSQQLQKGTATDIEGNFEIEIGASDTLSFTYVGYTPVELEVQDQTEIEVIMVENYELLEEIIVIGYGTQKKKDVTGAMTSVDEENFNSGVVNSPEQLIRGKVAGVELIQNDGEPGSAFTVRIRGASTIRAGNDPLYVIDGYPVNINEPQLIQNGARLTRKNALEFLNPEDIASIDILKDASAAAIYGARGANGVILITTKKGQAGRTQLTYSNYFSISQLRKKFDVLSPEEYVSALNDFGLTGQDFGARTDWQDEVYRTAFAHNHNLSFNGGAENSRYRASLNFKDEEGIIRTSRHTKYSGRISLQQKALDEKVNLEFNLVASRIRDRRTPEGVVIGTISQNPTWPIRDTDGNFFQSTPIAEFNHPLANLELYSNVIHSTRVLGNLSLSYKLLDELEYKLNVGGDISNTSGKSYAYRQISAANGFAEISGRQLNSHLIEHYLTYREQIGILDFTGLAGYSYQEFQQEGSVFSKTDFPSDNIPLVNNISSGAQLQQDFSWKEKHAIQSLFGRVHIDYASKYLLTANFRADGSTRFGENYKYGYFPSVALAWRLSQEDFLSGWSALDDLKLRIGWGLTGNQEIPNKITQPVYGTPRNGQAVIGPTGQPIIGYAFTRTANPDLQWEETRQINIGIDLSLNQGRWNLTMDYFDKRTTDFLLFTSAVSAPTPSVWVNLDGEILNRGWEMAMNGHVLNTGDFQWETSGTITVIDNNVKGLSNPIAVGFEFGRGQSGVIPQAIFNDEPLGVFAGRTWLGFDETGNDIFLKDEDGNDDLGVLGYALPDVTWGWSNNMQFKNFELDFLFTAAHGHEVFNNGALAAIPKQSFQFGSNTTPAILNSDENINNNLTYSSRFLEDGSYVRLSNVTLSYRFPIGATSSLRQLQIYLTGSNLWVSNKYSGYDSEVNIPIINNNSIPSIGIDWDAVPRPMSFQLGIRANFL
ncbi:MAG: TonB-dependent receptor [Bacteroidia bacterium]|nr:TonB-dependent receptor [Bacteroidia bacterium]